MAGGTRPGARSCPSAADRRDVDVTYFHDGTWTWVSNCRVSFSGDELLERTAEIVADLR